MSIVTRFAPSPTGRLHLGHILSACIAQDLARQSSEGKFLLRMEDIDASRVRPEYEAGIIEDLAWLGLKWDGEILRQSERHDAYQRALHQLQAMGLVYPCFCTRKEIQAEIKAMGGAPHDYEAAYPGTCRKLSACEREARMAAGESHAWRLDSRRTANRVGPLTFEDGHRGKIEVNPDLLGDVVISRRDIGVAYHLAVVVDDSHQKISLVSRGEDLLPSTHVHRLLQAALDLNEPGYHHHHLLRDKDGKRLAKRYDALSIESLRQSGKNAGEIIEQITSLALPPR